MSKPKIYVSYYHKGDQKYFDEFARLFMDQCFIASDTSPSRGRP